jgi:hypothetical protein
MYVGVRLMAAPENKAPRITVEPDVQACHARRCAITEGGKCNCKPKFLVASTVALRGGRRPDDQVCGVTSLSGAIGRLETSRLWHHKVRQDEQREAAESGDRLERRHGSHSSRSHAPPNAQ